MAGISDILTTIQNGVVAVGNLAQLLTQATVNSSSLRVRLAGVVTQINTGSGLTGGPITGSGTISLLSSVGTVTTINTSIGLTGGPITTSGTLAVSLTTLTNSISSDHALNNTGNYFDGPTVAQGTSGVWLATGNVNLTDSAGAASMEAKLWDGTTVIDSGLATMFSAGGRVVISLSGVLTNPANNIKISAKDPTSVNGTMLASITGEGKDSTLTVVRIG